MKNPKRVKQGKRNRRSGADFERRVRKDLEEKGWIVSRWQNNLDYPKENINLPPDKRKDYKLIPAKQGRFRLTSTGFPDYLAYRLLVLKEWNVMNGIATNGYVYEIIGVECKSNGYLDKQEKEKCKWLLKNNIFSRILVAYKRKDGKKVVVEYKEIK